MPEKTSKLPTARKRQIKKDPKSIPIAEDKDYLKKINLNVAIPPAIIEKISYEGIIKNPPDRIGYDLIRNRYDKLFGISLQRGEEDRTDLCNVRDLFARESSLLEAVERLPAEQALRVFVVLRQLELSDANTLTTAADKAFGPQKVGSSIVCALLLSERIRRATTDGPGPLNALFSGQVSAARTMKHNRRARRQRRQMLLESREFSAVMKMLRGDRELQRELAPFLRRYAEFRKGRVDPEAIRLGMDRDMQKQASHTTAFFAGLVNSPRLNWVLQRAIDRKVEADTVVIRSKLRGPEVIKLPELISGSGVHAANYVSTRFMMVPEKMGIVSERRSKIGGEFWLAPNGLWELNSETNRFGEDLGLSPGGFGALNSFGPMAVVQQPDLEGAVYGSNQRMGAAARINIVNSAVAITNSDTIAVYRNNDLAKAVLPQKIRKNAPENAIVLELRDPRTFESVFALVDRHMYAGGLNKSKDGFDLSDPETAGIIADEYAKAARGEQAQIYNFDGLTERLGDPSLPHPLEGFDEAVILGGGDGQRIILEALRGHSVLGRTTKQLDSIDTIKIFGADYEDRDEFLEKVRPRYASTAIEFKGDIKDFRHSTDLSKLRAYRLRRDEKGKIVLILKNPENGEVSEYTPKGKKPIIANLTGFKVDGLEVFESLGRKYYTPSQAIDAGAELLKQGTILRYKPELTSLLGTSALVDQTKITGITSKQDSTVIYAELTTTEGISVPREYVYRETNIDKVARDFFSDPALLIASEKVRQVDTDKVVYAYTNGVSGPGDSELTPIARQIDGLEIYAFGPSAKLPLAPQTKRLIDLLGVSENTVAIWVYQRGVTLLATYLAQKDQGGGDTVGILPNFINTKTKELPLTNLSTRARTETFDFNGYSVTQKLPFDMNRIDLVRLAACASLGENKLPNTQKLNNLAFCIELDEKTKGSGGLRYRIRYPAGFPKDSEYTDLVKNLLSDPDIQFAIHEKLIPPKASMGRDPAKVGLKIEIPVGKDGSGIRRLQLERLNINEYDLS